MNATPATGNPWHGGRGVLCGNIQDITPVPFQNNSHEKELSMKTFSPTPRELQARVLMTRFGLSRNRAQLVAAHVYGEARK